MTKEIIEKVIKAYDVVGKARKRINTIERVRLQAENNYYGGYLNILQTNKELFDDSIGAYVRDTIDMLMEFAQRDLQKAEKTLEEL